LAGVFFVTQTHDVVRILLNPELDRMVSVPDIVPRRAEHTFSEASDAAP
jgi:hypothetical protein